MTNGDGELHTMVVISFLVTGTNTYITWNLFKFTLQMQELKNTPLNIQYKCFCTNRVKNI